MEEKNGSEAIEVGRNLKDRKVSWARLHRVDSLHLEAGRISGSHHESHYDWKTTLTLAFQCIGIIYGDIGTSPLYVYANTFTSGIGHPDDLLGVLSLIIYTILLVPMIKYVFIVLWANDNGDGGTFALYSLLCRSAKIGLIPNDEPEDRELSNYRLDTPSSQLRRAYKIKEKLQSSHTAKVLLFLVTIMGTSMVIGDGVFTPCISVLSAVSGIGNLGKDTVVGVTIAILVILFSVQRFGTDKVGSSFAPVVLLWYSFIGGIGIYNLVKYDATVLRAFNPLYVVNYFRRNGRKGWASLGGVFLCITGTEAMFADLGHFNVRAIQISFSGIVFPGLLTAYSGQAAYLSRFPENVGNTFYDSIPDPLYWPTFVVAVAAAIIASQAMISGVFAIVSQSLGLGCFPKVTVIHTSTKHEGQVYVPEVNYILMISCVIVTASFQSTERLGNAYGIAVSTVMVITTCMVTLIMLVIWKTSMWLILLFFVVFTLIDLVYLSAVLSKFVHGGYLPLAIALVLMIIMGTWHYVQKKRYIFQLNNKVSSEYVRELVANPDISRIPGIGLLFSELVQGIPPIFPHFIGNIPAIHSVIVFVSIKSIPISKVALEERFLFRQVEPREYRMFRCVVRYGYKDKMEEPEEFEQRLIEHLKEFIHSEHFILSGGTIDHEQFSDHSTNIALHSTPLGDDGKVKGDTINAEELLPRTTSSRVSLASISAANSRNSANGIVVTPLQGAEEEMQFVQNAMSRGVIYLLGETEVVAEPDSSIFKKFVVNYLYNFLRNNFKKGDRMLAVPVPRLLRVGMTYEI